MTVCVALKGPGGLSPEKKTKKSGFTYGLYSPKKDGSGGSPPREENKEKVILHMVWTPDDSVGLVLI